MPRVLADAGAFRRDIQRYRDPWTHPEESARMPPVWRDVPIVLRRPELWSLGVYRASRSAERSGRLVGGLGRPVFAVLRIVVQVLSGITLSARADVGPGLYIAHGHGVVIGGTSRLGSVCDIYQGVTLGMRSEGRFPVLGDAVFVGPGAVLAGGISVGSGARIGANAVVVRDVVSGARIVAPAPVNLASTS